MELQVVPNKELAELNAKFNDRRLLWTHIENYQRYQEAWYHDNFLKLDSETVEKEMKTFQTAIV